jgi:hypothetical protein
MENQGFKALLQGMPSQLLQLQLQPYYLTAKNALNKCNTIENAIQLVQLHTLPYTLLQKCA